MHDSTTSSVSTTSLCYVPSSLFSILLKYSSCVFSKRPSSLIPSLPLFSSTTHEIVGDASITFGDSSSPRLGITSLNFSNFSLRDKVVHLVGEREKGQSVEILFRLLEPRNVIHLPIPRYLNAEETEIIFALLHHRKNNHEQGEDRATSNENNIEEILASSLTSWCTELETAISTGKRFSPILKSHWSWRKAAGISISEGDEGDDDEMNHKSSKIVFRSEDPDRESIMTAIPLSLTVPIGTVCAASVAAKFGGIRTDGFPFDWILTPSLERSLKFISRILFSTTSKEKEEEEEGKDIFDLSVKNSNNHVKECTHVNDTNRYYSIDRTKDKETKATYLFQKDFSFIASTTEAARFERRCARLKDLFLQRILEQSNKNDGDANDDEEKYFCFVHIGKPFAHSENFTVDDELAAPELNRSNHDDGESENDDAAVQTNGFLQEDLYRARRLMTALQDFARDLVGNCESTMSKAKKVVTCFFFAFNVTSRCFTEIIEDATPSFAFKIVLIHQFIGYSSPSSMWDSIGHVAGRHLPGKHLMAKKVVDGEGGFL